MILEKMDDLAQGFAFDKMYAAPEQIRQFIEELLNSTDLSVIKNS